MVKEFKVSYLPTAEGWLASVYTVPGCHCEADTREAAANKIRKALREFFDDADEAILVDEAPK